MTRRSLKHHLFGVIAAVALPLLVFSFILSIGSAQRQREMLERGLLETTDAVASAVESTLEGSFAALQVIAASRSIDAGDLAALYDEAVRALAFQPWYSVWLADTEGNVIFGLVRPYGTQGLPSIADREYFRAVMKTARPAISGLLESRLTSGYHIAMAVPVVREGRIRYVLAAGYKPQALTAILEAQPLGSRTDIASIVDASYRVIARSREPERWIGRLGSVPYVELIRSAERGLSKSQTVEGGAVYAAFRRLPRSGWTVGLGIAADEVEAPLVRNLWRTGALGAALLVIAVIGAVLLARRITMPISALAAAADALAEGREHAPPVESPIAEIAPLAAAVQRAADAARERKRTELALRESEEHFRLLFEQSADGIFLADAGGRYVDVNAAGTRLLGYSRKEILGMSIADIVAAHERERVPAELRQLASGAAVHNEWSFRRRDGTTFPGEVAARKLTDGRLLGVLRDMTERRAAEAALRERRAQIEHLQRLHTATITAAAIAHELGQPLSAIASYGEAALRMLDAGNQRPDRLTYALRMSAQEAQRAGRVVRELLELLQAREGTREAVDLNELVHKALAMVQADRWGGFDVVLDLQPDIPPITVNRLQIEKVLVNLLANAAEAMHRARARERTITICVRTHASREHAHVSVIDTGPGIDRADAQKIFQPFFTTKPHGLGVGLAISRAIVEAHGGRLWFEAGDEPGAAFHFTLSLDTQSPVATR